MIRTVLADDQELVRAGFRMILESEADLAVVGEAGDGAAAVELVERERPDVVLMDVRMPGVDGIEATRRIAAGPSGAHVLVLTTFDRDEYVYRALEAGAAGFLLKSAPPERLVDAVRTVTAGEALLAPSLTRRLIEEWLRRPRPEAQARLGELTERELEVLHLLAAGLSNAEIAQRLVVSDATVKTHVNHVLSKLALRDRVQAVIYAYESGLVRPGAR
ncbi:MAG TPA: response regulator transcription factor [Gaiellaceae bacterium]|nr:response regulator transcription factor [Gaiellaceae bacterium]